MKRAGQVDIDDPRPGFGADVGEWRKVKQPGTGHQHCNWAQFAADLGERVLEAGPVRDVGANPDRGDADGANIVGDTLRRLLIEVEDRDFEPAPAQFVARRLTHARGAAGHDRYPAHRLRSIPVGPLVFTRRPPARCGWSGEPDTSAPSRRPPRG